MDYFFTYNSPSAQRYNDHYHDHRYSTKVDIEAPGFSFSSSYHTSPPRSIKLRYSSYRSRDEHYYDYHDNYCYGAGASSPAYSSNWEDSRAPSPRPYSQRIRIRSDACLDESPSRRPHRDSNTYRYSGRDRATIRPITTTTNRRATRRTTITITTM